jgi:hypothetical protein
MTCAPEDSIREELIGAVLGELSLLRRDVGELQKTVEQSSATFKDNSDLAILRLAARSDQFLTDFRASSAEVLARAKDFGEAREQLLAEIALRQYDEIHDRHRKFLQDVLSESCSGNVVGRLEMFLWSAATAGLSAVLSLLLAGALR